MKTGNGEKMLTCDCGKDFKNSTGLSIHKARYCASSSNNHAATTSKQVRKTEAFSTTLFSVIDGETHIRGCEFKGGFLVVDGDHIGLYPTLADALSNAKQSKAIPAVAEPTY